MMTKKQKEALINERNELKIRLYSMLLGALGFDVVNGCLQDQDTMTPIIMNGGRVIYSIDGTEIPTHKRDVIFDPVDNRYLTNVLFKLFLEKEERENDVYVKMFYQMENTNGISVVCVLPSGKLETEPYKLSHYGYLEMMIVMYNSTLNVDVVQILKRLEELTNDLQ